MRRVVLALAALAGAAAETSAAGPLSDQEAAQLAARALAARYATSYGGRTQPCTSFFDISNVRVADKRVAGTTAQIEVAFSVRSKHKIASNAFASNDCYGAPEGGWNPGQVATSRAGFKLERWNAGWRIVGLAPVR